MTPEPITRRSFLAALAVAVGAALAWCYGIERRPRAGDEVQHAFDRDAQYRYALVSRVGFEEGPKGGELWLAHHMARPGHIVRVKVGYWWKVV